MELKHNMVFEGQCDCCGLEFSENEFFGVERDGVAMCENCDEERPDGWRAQDEHDAHYGYDDY